MGYRLVDSIQAHKLDGLALVVSCSEVVFVIPSCTPPFFLGQFYHPSHAYELEFIGEYSDISGWGFRNYDDELIFVKEYEEEYLITYEDRPVETFPKHEMSHESRLNALMKMPEALFPPSMFKVEFIERVDYRVNRGHTQIWFHSEISPRKNRNSDFDNGKEKIIRRAFVNLNKIECLIPIEILESK